MQKNVTIKKMDKFLFFVTCMRCAQLLYNTIIYILDKLKNDAILGLLGKHNEFDSIFELDFLKILL